MGIAASELESALDGRYRFERVIGRGGMATVYLAEDLRHCRPVAIKVLDPDVADVIGPGRFQSEIEILAPLAHPHIVPLLDSGAAAGLLYYVMPFVEGESLAGRMAREGRLPLHDTVRIAREIADALEFAHGRGFLHRDIKPENILLAGGHAMLADFGIARAIEPAPGARLTESGFSPGTPDYMSPEQAAGLATLDARSDQYSLAFVVYEMLAGQPPFGEIPAIARGYVIASADPRPLVSIRGDVPGAVDHALLRALAREPADRFPGVAAFAAALGEAPAAGAAVDDAPGRPPVPNNLPARLSSFIGREHETWECLHLLRGGRLLTLTGIGGCGKTRLALRIAERLLRDAFDGVTFVDLGPLGDPRRVAPAIGSALRLREDPARAVEEALVEAFQNTRALVLLDNCEHVLEACASLAQDLLARCPGLTILATSREPLRVEGERTYSVPPLSLPDPHAVAGASAAARSEAIRLFVERARLAEPQFELNAGNAATVADLCRQLDGIPLAIELAAARTRMLSVEEIRVRLTDRFRLLGGGVSAPARHLTLRAALQWSYDLLEPAESELLNALAVFAGGWTLEGATAVCGEGASEYETLDRMTLLVEKSLVMVDVLEAGERRFRLLETVRQFGLMQLDAGERATSVRSRHADFYLALAEKAESLLWGPAQLEWFTRLETEHDNLLAAMDWSSRSADTVLTGLGIAGALYRFWYSRGHFAVPRRMLHELLGRPGADRPVLPRAKALYAAAGIAVFQGDHASARPLYDEALSVYRGLGDRRGIARSLVGIGNMETAEGHYAQARVALEACIALYREMGERKSMQVALHNLGEVEMSEGRLAEARRTYSESVTYGEDGGNPAILALTLSALGVTHLRLGETHEAAGAIERGLRLVAELKAAHSGVEALDSAAQLAAALRHPARAVRLLAGASRLRQVLGLPRTLVARAAAEVFETRLRAAVEAESFETERLNGESMDLERAVEDALEIARAAGPDARH